MDALLDDIISSQPTAVGDEEEAKGLEPSSQEPEGNDADAPRAVRALRLLSQAGITLSTLIKEVFMGDQDVRGIPIVVKARTEVFESGVLSQVASRIYRPPDTRLHGKAHIEAANQRKDWAIETSIDVLRCELATHAKSTKAGDVEREVVNEESLKKLTFDAISDKVQTNAPRLYSALMKICEAPRQEKNTHKDAKFVS